MDSTTNYPSRSASHLTLFPLANLLKYWLHNLRSRHQLAQLGERELADAGIDRCQRESELSKPFWR